MASYGSGPSAVALGGHGAADGGSPPQVVLGGVTGNELLVARMGAAQAAVTRSGTMVAGLIESRPSAARRAP